MVWKFHEKMIRHSDTNFNLFIFVWFNLYFPPSCEDTKQSFLSTLRLFDHWHLLLALTCCAHDQLPNIFSMDGVKYWCIKSKEWISSKMAHYPFQAWQIYTAVEMVKKVKVRFFFLTDVCLLQRIYFYIGGSRKCPPPPHSYILSADWRCFCGRNWRYI